MIKHYVPTLDEIKRLYAHANVRDKALLLVLAQSGFSEADVTELRKSMQFPSMFSAYCTDNFSFLSTNGAEDLITRLPMD